MNPAAMSHVGRHCRVCGTPLTGRSDAQTCGPTCRKRLQREPPYVVTPEDRAAMDVAATLVPIPVPPLTPEQIATHVLRTARRA